MAGNSPMTKNISLFLSGGKNVTELLEFSLPGEQKMNMVLHDNESQTDF